MSISAAAASLDIHPFSPLRVTERNPPPPPLFKMATTLCPHPSVRQAEITEGTGRPLSAAPLKRPGGGPRGPLTQTGQSAIKTVAAAANSIQTPGGGGRRAPTPRPPDDPDGRTHARSVCQERLLSVPRLAWSLRRSRVKRRVNKMKQFITLCLVSDQSDVCSFFNLNTFKTKVRRRKKKQKDNFIVTSLSQASDQSDMCLDPRSPAESGGEACFPGKQLPNSALLVTVRARASMHAKITCLCVCVSMQLCTADSSKVLTDGLVKTNL